MGDRLLRTTTSLVAAIAVAVWARPFAEPLVLSTPLGAPTATVEVSAEELECPLLAAEPGDCTLASLAMGSGAVVAQPSVCAVGQSPILEIAAAGTIPVLSAAPPEGVPVAQAPVGSELEVVHARVAAHGTVEVIGRPGVSVDRKVLAIVARELAYPQTLKRGTTLEAVYEVDGTRAQVVALTIGKGLAARRAFYFRSHTAGAEGFFARDGQSLEHRFLRYPVSYDLVTSPFSAARFHPILAAWRPHNGVDFGARPGTSVLAVGAGKIKAAGWDGRFGRTVTIAHDGGYVSRYSHLQGYASGVRVGASVRKGQVIGYVGTSGLSTGPHLHFSMLKNGAYVDPLGRNLPKRASLDAKMLGQFRGTVARVERALAADAAHPTTQVAARTSTAGRKRS